MPSPFPGMDPYLESDDAWHDFHVRFVPAVAAVLMADLPEPYIVKADQDVFIRELSADERRLVGRPDSFVVRGNAPADASAATATATRPAAASVPGAIPVVGVDAERHAFLRIIDRRNRAVVTAIEVLSPSNKSPSGDRAAYLAKRQRYQIGGTNLVEIDLLRDGPRLPIDGLPPCDYYAMACGAADWPAVRLWPVGIRDPLPVIAVPLSAADADVTLDLRAAMDRSYDAQYERYIYNDDLSPPITPADAAWAAAVAVSVARRRS